MRVLERRRCPGSGGGCSQGKMPRARPVQARADRGSGLAAPDPAGAHPPTAALRQTSGAPGGAAAATARCGPRGAGPGSASTARPLPGGPGRGHGEEAQEAQVGQTSLRGWVPPGVGGQRPPGSAARSGRGPRSPQRRPPRPAGPSAGAVRTLRAEAAESGALAPPADPGTGDGRRARLCAGEKQLQGLEMRKWCDEEEERSRGLLRTGLCFIWYSHSLFLCRFKNM